MRAAGPLLTVIVLSYGLHITVVSYALYVLRRIVMVEPSPPGWISLRLLTWSAAVLSGTAAVITWLHASGLRTALDPRALPLLGQAVDRLCDRGVCVSRARARAECRRSTAADRRRHSLYGRDDSVDCGSALDSRGGVWPVDVCATRRRR